MKKLIVVLILMFASVSQAAWFSKDEPEIKVGQIWQDGGYVYEILDVGKKYVVYEFTGREARCDTIKDFLDDYELLKDVIKSETKGETCGLIHCTKECYRCDNNRQFISYDDCCTGVYGHSESCKYSNASLLEEIEALKPRKPEPVTDDIVWTITDYEDDSLTSTITIGTTPSKPYLHKNPNNEHWICSKHGDLSEDDKGVVSYGTTISLLGGPEYCMDCVGEVLTNNLNEHIKGVQDEN